MSRQRAKLTGEQKDDGQVPVPRPHVDRNADRPVSYRGLPEYLDAAAEAAGLDDPDLRAKAGFGWHAQAVNSTLSQLVELAKDGRSRHLPGDPVAEMLGRAESILKSLSVQRDALATAVEDVRALVGDAGSAALATPDDRKPLNAGRLKPEADDPNRPGAHRPDRPSPPSPRPAVDPAKKGRTAVSKQDKDKDKAADKPVSPGKPEVDDKGRPLMPPADVDGDGDKEQIPYDGPHTDPTVPPESHEDDESK